MGKMKVIKEAHQDFTTNDTRWVSVTFEPVESIMPPIPLEKIKANKKFENIGLIKQPRLEVMKLSKKEFEDLLKEDVE